MKRAKRTIVILSLALAGCRGTIGPPSATPDVLSLHILTTPATTALIQELAAKYAPRDAVVNLRSVTLNWDAIEQQLLAGEASYALTTYLPPVPGLWTAPIGYDALAIIVPSTLSLDALTLDQVRRLFQGQIADWDEIGGPSLPVTVVVQTPDSDASRVFDAQVMGGHRVTLGARLALSNASMVELVAQTPGAIGYVSMSALGDGVRTVPLRAENGPAVTLSRESVTGGDYPLRAPIVVTGLSEPERDSAYYAWFAWMQSPEGQAVLSRRYAPLHP